MGIWLMLDKRNKDMDRRLAEHLVSLYSETGVCKKVEAEISADLFRRYVAFAKKWVHPTISDGASDSLVRNYAELRNQGGSAEVITATPRILESLIRISESLAKMEQLVAGAGAGRRRRVKELGALLQEVCIELSKKGDVLTVDQIKAAMNEKLGTRLEHLITDSEFNKAMETAQAEEFIVRQGKQVELRGS